MPGEVPQHRVRITKPYWLGVTEVTQEEDLERVMGSNPSKFHGVKSNFPWIKSLGMRRWSSVGGCRSCPLEKRAKRRYRVTNGGTVGVRVPRGKPRPVVL